MKQWARLKALPRCAGGKGVSQRSSILSGDRAALLGAWRRTPRAALLRRTFLSIARSDEATGRG